MLATEKDCPECGRRNRATAFLCTECKHSLAGVPQAPSEVEPLVTAPTPEELTAADLQKSTRRHVSYRERTGESRSTEYFSLKNSLISLGLGALLCLWDSFGGIGSFALHFFGALVHEIGHAAWATFFGAPSFPVISLTGHAAALHGGQSTLLAVGIWLFFGYMAYAMRREGKAWKLYAWIAAYYPLIAFTGLWHPLFLLAGHGGELVFAGVFFWRAWTGGFTHSLQERYLYASLAWFLAVNNCVFHFKLMTSAAYRAHYHTNGSFGLVNDYIRVAENVGVSLPAVAGVMLFVNIIVLPLAVWLFVRRVVSLVAD